MTVTTEQILVRTQPHSVYKLKIGEKKLITSPLTKPNPPHAVRPQPAPAAASSSRMPQ